VNNLLWRCKKPNCIFSKTAPCFIAPFQYDETAKQARLLREVALKDQEKDQEGKLFCDRLHFRFLQSRYSPNKRMNG
jgi:hypothetical protein